MIDRSFCNPISTSACNTSCWGTCPLRYRVSAFCLNSPNNFKEPSFTSIALSTKWKSKKAFLASSVNCSFTSSISFSVALASAWALSPRSLSFPRPGNFCANSTLNAKLTWFEPMVPGANHPPTFGSSKDIAWGYLDHAASDAATIAVNVGFLSKTSRTKSSAVRFFREENAGTFPGPSSIWFSTLLSVDSFGVVFLTTVESSFLSTGTTTGAKLSSTCGKSTHPGKLKIEARYKLFIAWVRIFIALRTLKGLTSLFTITLIKSVLLLNKLKWKSGLSQLQRY